MIEADTVRVVGISGSARADSLNSKLVVAALDACAAQGAVTTWVDLREYSMPIYDGDFESAHGLPENAMRLRELLMTNHGMVVASPEYNGSITALLKNTLDWISRSPDATPDLRPYRGKFAAIVSASPGPLGGMRGLRVIREVLTNLGVNVLADQIALRNASAEFTQEGTLVQESHRKQLDRLARELVEVLRARVAGAGVG